ncbi:MAG: radical SAM family heme chaperone HemW [Firmicutes bacterium]|nr:radical SAM family heme chaperone HemW [Bacillota bacterium]
MEKEAARFAGIYIHIPFCLRKCKYCDFVSYPAPADSPLLRQYVDWLAAEWRLWQEQGDFRHCASLYLGGGTPSLLPAEEIARLLEILPPAEEITLEANPETVDERKLALWRQAGINRLSLGAQSFHQRLLQAMGRGHDGEQTRQAVAAARQAGFDNIGLDLIYGLPGQTLADWKQDVARALALQPQHLSLYGLTLAPETPWGRQAAAGRLTPAAEEEAAAMLAFAMEALESAGLHQYEIANFARPGRASRHNQVYWRREDYLGLGAAACSCAGNRRFANHRRLEDYRQALEQGRLPIAEEESLSPRQVLGEAMFLGLRLRQGVDQQAFAQRYGVRPDQLYGPALKKLIQNGLLEEDGPWLRLTRRGLFLANQVFVEFV